MKTEITIAYTKNVEAFCHLTGIDTQHFFDWSKNPVYEIFYVPKKSGGRRKIVSPLNSGKKILRAIHDALYPVYLELKPDCACTTISEHASYHTKARHLLSVDILKFYPSIRINQVYRLFKQAPFSFSDELASVLALATTYETCLPAGAPCSPVLANLVFTAIDKKLQALAQRHGFKYSRYADDLCFSSPLKINEQFLSELESVIYPYGFKLNYRKTRFSSYKTCQNVTGLVVNKKVNVSRKNIRNLRAIFHSIETKGIAYTLKRYNNMYPNKLRGSGEPNAFEQELLIGLMKEHFFEIVKGKVDFIGQIRGREDDLYKKMKAKLTALQKNIVENN